MTFFSSKYEWTAFTEADLLANGQNGYDFGCGDSFVMPSHGTVTMSTYDDDHSLSGDDDWWCNNNATDWTGQAAYVDGSRVGSQMYAEQYHVLCGSDGKTYYLVEIKIECHDSAGAGNGYFTFYGDVPPAGVSLTVTNTCNVSGSGLNYSCLGANPPAPAPGTITGRLTFDADNDDTEVNSSHGGWDSGFGGKTVQLLDKDGNVVATTTTDSYGTYSFTVAQGEYRVAFPELSGYQFADKDVGAEGEDSDANANGQTDLITLGSGQCIQNIDASLQKANSAPVFTNAPADPFCVDENTTAVIDLNATDADCDTLTYKIVGGTDASKFTIDAHTGELSFVDAPDYENPGSADGDNTYNVIVAVSDGKGGESHKALTVNVCDVDEPTGGQCIVLEAEDMQLCGYTVKCASSASGNEYISLHGYSGSAKATFNGVAGSYDLTVRHYDQSGSGYIKVLVNGTEVKTIHLNADDNQWHETVISDLDLKPGDVVSLQTYGAGCEYAIVDSLKFCPNAPELGAIEGRLFCDENKDGLDNAEPGIAGVTVVLVTADGTQVGTTTTAADGSYSFTDLPEGDYKVIFPKVVDGKVLTDQNVGSDDTIDSDANTGTGQTDAVTVVGGQTTSDVDAGVKDPGTAAINGRIFCDENDNSVDDGEPGIGGVTVKLLNAAGAVIATTTTAADGSYGFSGLDAGDYRVEFPTVVDGKVLVDSNVGGDDTIDSDADKGTGQTGTISLDIGETVNDVDAGVEDPGTAAIEGRYFCDENRNDIDDGEPGIAGVKVELLNAAGAVVATTMTAADGSYSFTGLDAGDYQVRFPTSAEGKTLVATDAGTDDTVDSDADQATGLTGTISLNIGETVTDVDAGVADPATASIGNQVWIDANKNGVQDSGEAGLAGVAVTLYDADGNAVANTTTDANGLYLFSGLVAGTYSVGFAEPVGYDFTTANVGNDALDSDANAATGRTGAITLAIGETNLTVDAGVVVENKAPTPMDDAAGTCADEAKTVDVLANDSDPDGDALTITEVDGQAITVGATVTTSAGTLVTLNADGTLTVDGATAYASLDIGEHANETISYSVSDGNGGSASADLAMKFCGDANSVESLIASLPTTISYNIRDGFDDSPVGSYAFDLQVVGTGDARLDGKWFAEAYCLDFGAALRSIQDGSPTVNTGALFGSQDAAAASVFASQTSHANGLAASENLDLLNWVIAQDFEGAGYSPWEVQFAVWELVDDFDASKVDYSAFGSDASYADVQFIVQQALANDGFVAGVGDSIGVIVEPGDADPANVQPFIFAMDWEANDCLC